MIVECKREFVPEIYEVEKDAFKPEDVYDQDLLRFLCSFCKSTSYVYFLGEEVVGYIIACPEGRSLHILSIAVKSKSRGKGIGKALLCSTLSLLASGEYDEVFLEVRASNTRAIDLYRNAGFEIVEILPRYYNDGEDGLRMRARDRERAREYCLKLR